MWGGFPPTTRRRDCAAGVFRDSPARTWHPVYTLCATSLPVGKTEPTDYGNLVTDPVSGQQAIANELLVAFVEGTTEDKIKSIVASINGTVIGTVPGLGIYQVRLSQPSASSSDLQTLINTLSSNPEVKAVEPSLVLSTDTFTPTDQNFAQQDGVKKIRADEAWYIARGGSTIAVVDSGADFGHSDLKNKLLKGWDFVGNDNDPTDEYGHGTHVAGIAAAETNNGTGIAGISWESKVYIVRVHNDKGKGSLFDTVAGIEKAAASGSRIINMSFGTSGWFSGLIQSFFICNAVDKAVAKGSILVASAGNANTSTKQYPAACSNVIAVGATTSTDAKAPFSNFGAWVDVAAPGVDILSTVPTGTCPLCDPSGYRSLPGTSMASPMVAGATAVLLAREPLTNAKVEERFKRTAKRLLPDPQLGAGRIDLFEAVFNGSFEEENMALWQTQGTVSSQPGLGTPETKPQDRYRLGYASTGPDGAQVTGELTQTFQVQAGVTSIPVTFKYAFLSEEFPEFVGSIYNDSLTIKLRAPNGAETVLATESINASAYSMISGLDFPGGDTTVGWTGWKTVSVDIPVTAGAGTYDLFLSDAGDGIYDTVVLVDCIQFRKQADMICTPAP